MKKGTLIFLCMALIMTIISITLYSKQLQPELKFVGIDYWNHTADAIHIMVDPKTNDLYLQNPDGTDTHIWIRKSTGKPVKLGEELPVENGGK